jgi:uncharacterized protein YecE (DUF72 family)
MPKAAMLEGWAAEVPADFKFVLKASQKITHIQRLKDTDASVSYLLEVAGTLKEGRRAIEAFFGIVASRSACRF